MVGSRFVQQIPYALRVLGWAIVACLLHGPFVACAQEAVNPKDRLKVALIVGDTQSAATLTAIHQLKTDPLTESFEVKLFVKGDLEKGERQFVEASDIVVVYPRFAGLVRGLLPQIKEAHQRGALVVGVGPTIEPEFSGHGIERDSEISAYFEAGGSNNLVQMVRFAANKKTKPTLPVEPPRAWPEFGYFNPETGTAVTDFNDYIRGHEANETEQVKRRTDSRVGILFSRENAVGGDIEVLNSLNRSMHSRGLTPIFAFGYPGDEAIAKLFIDDSGKSRVDAVVALTLKIGNVPEKIVPILESLNVPVINGIALNSLSLSQWRNSSVGLDSIERSWQVGAAEFAGTISPTVLATRETVVDSATGQKFVLTMPFQERIERVSNRIAAWIRLRKLEAKEKRLAIIYYNYPPGRESIGASYLNVMPDSLHAITQKLRESGFELGECPREATQLFDVVHAFGSNPLADETAKVELQRLVESKRVQLLPIKTYRKWFDQLPKKFRDMVVQQWGEPEVSDVMTWKDDLQESYFVFPVLRYGNILLGPQPTRGWQHDIEAVYHDISLPPHHQYIAFYLWLQLVFEADACLHVGTHATHEWLPGREVGFGEEDSGEIIVGSIPQLYLYIVDDVGEGLQAKRRGMAALITHQTPPLDRASLSVDLRELSSLITDFSVAQDKGSAAASGLLVEITNRSREKGLLTELSIDLEDSETLDSDQLEEVEHHLKRIGERLTPFGMHTYGETFSTSAKKSTIEAILSIESDLDAESRASREADLASKLERSGQAEWDALFKGLNGEYIPAGPGGDPIRNSEVLPTGKNFYGFDPARMPSAATYEEGRKLANDFLLDYARKHSGAIPTRLVFNLWGTESSRHEGIVEAQIMALMGVRPVWDSRGRVQDIELISRSELGRTRVDITIVPSGLYRDLFSKLMLLLDRAVDKVKQDLSDDNPVLQNIRHTTEQLVKKGVEPEVAQRLASVRLFSLPSGAYGAGLEHVIQAEDTWQSEKDVSAVYMNRLSHLFGQGFWGERARTGEKGDDLSPFIFREAMKGAGGVVHSRSSNVFGAVDSDDFYQYLGGTALAVREANDGKNVEAYVADLSNPKRSEVVTLQQYIGQEMRARYFNPKWIEAMLNEGYAGSRMIRQVTDNLWGWQVTVPEAVGDSKWQEMYEVYVEDRYGLDIRRRFEAGDNLAAYRALVERMQSVIAKGYWKPDSTVSERLAQVSQELQPLVEQEKEQVEERAEMQPAPSSIPLPSTLTRMDQQLTNKFGVSGQAPSEVAAKSEGAIEQTQQLIEMVQGFSVQTERSMDTGNEPSRQSSDDIATQMVKVISVMIAIGTLILFGWFRSGA